MRMSLAQSTKAMSEALKFLERHSIATQDETRPSEYERVFAVRYHIE